MTPAPRHVVCPNPACHYELSVPEKRWLDGSAKCPQCRETFALPRLDQTAPCELPAVTR